MNLRSRPPSRATAPWRAVGAFAGALASARSSLFLGSVVAALAAVSSLEAQIVSAGATGVVRSGQGVPIASAQVTAVHVPTGTTYTAMSRADGRFDFRSIIVGGPYEFSVDADGFKAATRGGLSTILGADVQVNFALESDAGDVIVLDEFSVEAATNDLNAAALGAGEVISEEDLGRKPTSERSLADMISASSLVTLRAFGGDREEAQITAVGQNNRFNSIQIDGSRINDQFGLNGTGLASFFNPLSLDTIEQLAVQVSPYDVRQAGFTGASINAVTKSGTNQFKGSVYYYFGGDEFLGLKLRGENARERVVSNTSVRPTLERQTFGATLGGPVLKNRLFFFLNYEKFTRDSAGRDSRLAPDAAQLSAIVSRFQAYSTASGRSIDWGAPVSESTINASEDEKIIAKLDWNISSAHRASLRYSKTEGFVPQFGDFGRSTKNNFLTLSGGPVTALDGHFYSQERVEETWAAQVFSQWSDSFKTEIKYSATTQDQVTPVRTVAPTVAIYGLAGISLDTGAPTSGGVLVAGTEQFRQGNQINVDSKQMSAVADYFAGSWVFSGGFEREESDFFNLFREGSYGLVAFSSVANFLADTPTRIERNVFDPNLRPIGDISDFATNGIFAQAKWNATPRLNVLFGLRYEFAESGARPAFNQPFFAATGFRNDGTIDGASTISPRIAFNWAADERRELQIRGGIGHFSGRAPWVIFSNSYNSIGVGSFTQVTTTGASLTSYLQNEFDPANPIGTAVDTGAVTREINWADDGVELPAVWRANLAFDRRLSFLDSVFSMEFVQTYVDQALFITNENLRPLVGANARGADGRLRFAGNPTLDTGGVSNALYPAFRDLYRISNVGAAGKSRYLTLSLDRPLKNRWGFNLSYTRGDATEAQAIGQTTASGQWRRNVVFNQGQVEVGTSDFEIKNRVQLSYTREFEFRDGWRTRASLYYEGRSGNPYSWIYTTDLNGDGRNDNDLIAVPTGTDDPRFDFSAMSATDIGTYFDRLESLGLADYAGAIAPKNAFLEPWVNRLDLKISQQVPLRGSARLELFFDFINLGAFISESFFGYYEETNLLSNDVFRRRTLGGASYGPDGRIRPTVGAPSVQVINNDQSRWRVQLGAKVTF